MSNESIRQKLILFLNDKKVMQIKIAEVADCSPQTINMFIKNKRDISMKKLILISQYIEANS